MANRTARPGEMNHNAVDRFTLGHGAVGVLMGLARFPPWAAVVIAVGWELIENPLKDRFPQVFPHASHDTPQNATFDVLAMLLGYAAIKALPQPPGKA